MPIIQSDFDHLMTQAKVKLVGASEGGLKGEFYDVVSEFFNDSSIWTQGIQFTAIPNVLTYPLFVSEGQILRLNGVVNFGTTLPVPGQPLVAPPTPVPALMPEIGQLCLAHAPPAANIMVANVVTNVSAIDRKNIPLMPDWVLPVWHVGLLDGLLGKMMAQPNKSYFNDKQSAYHLKRFRDAIARARVSKLRANTIGAQAWRFPQGFRANTQQGGVPATSGTERTF